MSDEYLMPAPSGSAATDTANLQTAVSETITKAQTFGLYGGVIQLRAGRYKFTNAEIRGAIRLRLQGVFGQTVIEYAGDALGSALTLVNSQWCELRDFDIDMGAGGAAAIRLLRDGGTGFAPSQNQIRNVRIDGRNATPVGVLIGGVNQNNDFHVIEDVQFADCTYAEVVTGDSQCYNVELNRCYFAAGVGGQHAVVAEYGKVRINGGRSLGHARATLLMRGFGMSNEVTGLNIEGDKRLFECIGGHTSYIHAVNVRYAGNLAHEDGRFIVASGGTRAIIVMEDCHIGIGNNPSAAFVVDYSGAHADSKFHMLRGNFFTSAPSPFPANATVKDVFVFTATSPTIDYTVVNL